MRFLLSLVFLLSLPVWGAGEIQIPALSSPVMDQAGFLNENERADLSALAYEIHTHQGPQITILTVPDLQDYTIEDFSIRVGEKWKLGSKENDNGLLILIAKTERKMRIEVGNGIEGEITDFEANQYIRQVLTPKFQQGDFHGGLRIVMEDVAKKFNITFTPAGNKFVRRSRVSNAAPIKIPFPVIIILLALLIGQFLIKKPAIRGIVTGGGLAGIGGMMFSLAAIGPIIILFIVGLLIGIIGLHNILLALAAGSGGRYHGGGGFGGGGSGGGGWSGGGGGFSGGGSSGSW